MYATASDDYLRECDEQPQEPPPTTTRELALKREDGWRDLVEATLSEFDANGNPYATCALDVDHCPF